MMIVPAGVKVHWRWAIPTCARAWMGSRCWSRNSSRRIRSPAICLPSAAEGADLKILFWDGNGLCLFTKRIDQGGFIWPRDGGSWRQGDVVSRAARDADRRHRLARARARLAARLAG